MDWREYAPSPSTPDHRGGTAKRAWQTQEEGETLTRRQVPRIADADTLPLNSTTSSWGRAMMAIA